MKYKDTILVVDDSENVAKTLVMLLQESGYRAVAAYNAQHALGVISGMAVDLALIDINLPDKNGVATAMEICLRLPNCKILLFSGDAASTEILERAKKEGVDFPVLAKPVPPTELLATLRSLLKR